MFATDWDCRRDTGYKKKQNIPLPPRLLLLQGYPSYRTILYLDCDGGHNNLHK